MVGKTKILMAHCRHSQDILLFIKMTGILHLGQHKQNWKTLQMVTFICYCLVSTIMGANAGAQINCYYSPIQSV